MNHDCILTDLDNQVLLSKELDRRAKLIYAIGSSVVCACVLDAQLTISTGMLLDQLQKVSMETFIQIVKNVAEGCDAGKNGIEEQHSPM